MCGILFLLRWIFAYSVCIVYVQYSYIIWYPLHITNPFSHDVNWGNIEPDKDESGRFMYVASFW